MFVSMILKNCAAQVGGVALGGGGGNFTNARVANGLMDSMA